MLHELAARRSLSRLPNSATWFVRRDSNSDSPFPENALFRPGEEFKITLRAYAMKRKALGDDIRRYSQFCLAFSMFQPF